MKFLGFSAHFQFPRCLTSRCLRDLNVYQPVRRHLWHLRSWMPHAVCKLGGLFGFEEAPASRNASSSGTRAKGSQIIYADHPASSLERYVSRFCFAGVFRGSVSGYVSHTSGNQFVTRGIPPLLLALCCLLRVINVGFRGGAWGLPFTLLGAGTRRRLGDYEK